ncbi:UNKNOWN [Stylonychia lemnae]|uniref:Uncharacterized protein n=1 Tax=Stylonychia lemnae TaxID=5949 RepID=A0A078ABB2_STYLE|nr:UNKNOWN [Stylonychia lemnae]|eukprot:CDW79176.1 UNKNOWN [Stylonychia lemnae]
MLELQKFLCQEFSLVHEQIIDFELSFLNGGEIESLECLFNNDKIKFTFEYTNEEEKNEKIGGLKPTLLRRKPVQITQYMRNSDKSDIIRLQGGKSTDGESLSNKTTPFQQTQQRKNDQNKDKQILNIARKNNANKNSQIKQNKNHKQRSPNLDLYQAIYTHLRTSLIKNSSRYLINKLWAVQLGFQVKLRRSPKYNKDGSSTLRLYCTKMQQPNSKGQNQQQNSQNQNQKAKAESCQFAISFRFDPQNLIWLVYDQFDAYKFSHNHAIQVFDLSNIRPVQTLPDQSKLNLLVKKEQLTQENQAEDDTPVKEIVNDSPQFDLKKLLLNYRGMIQQLNKIDESIK